MTRRVKRFSLHRIDGTELRVVSDVDDGALPVIQVEEEVKTAMDKKRGADAEMILARLRPLACRYKSNPVVTDRMLVNAAFLVEGSREAQFDQAIQQLDVEVGHRLAFKYVNQAPPYNFVNIIINWNE